VLLSAAPTQQKRAQPRSDARADGALNVTTAEDIAYLYTLMLQGEIMAPSVCQEMLDLLAQQEINDRIPAYLPGGTIVAHKTGNLDSLVHDAGVIYAPAGPIVVVVLTEDMEEGIAVDLIAQIALAAYEAAS
jgi:beta-lactamase class A